MRLLWLTLADPEPATNGQFLYSRGLIRGIADAGAELLVVGLGRPGGAHRNGQTEGAIEWRLADHRPEPKIAGLASTLPFISYRTKTAQLRRMVDQALKSRKPDAIVFDSITIGWALGKALRAWPDAAERPALVYVSHNDETGVARVLARNERDPLKRAYKEIDSLRVARLERKLVHATDLVTANTPEDQLGFLARRGDHRVEFLPPGYDGRRVASRSIAADSPRRVIIVGTFDWLPKRQSLESFLAAADGPFAEAGVELLVVGNAEASYLDRVRERFKAARFTGYVDNVTKYLDDARIALVPDQLGGFKLKTFDYVFNRVPIFAIDGSVPGASLVAEESIMLFPDHRALTRGVLRAIDDFPLLHRLQENAYHACADRFDWSKIGRRFFAAVAALDRARRDESDLDLVRRYRDRFTTVPAAHASPR